MTKKPLTALLLLAVCAVAPSTANAEIKTGKAFKKAKWSSNVDVTIKDSKIRWRSDGLPNRGMIDEYAVPNFGVIVPDETTSHIESSSTAVKSQDYDFTIPTTPKLAEDKTKTFAGPVGLMINGPMIYNPYEGDGKTVALASNFTLTNAKGEDVPFADECNGHPSPTGAYHYHGRPDCVTAQVDKKNGPSHIIGIAFDGFPIYGDRDVDGKQIKGSQLDGCNGITSTTPEFPNGIYHYVLLNVPTKQSSPRCLRGEVSVKLSRTLARHALLCRLALPSEPVKDARR
jgi:hypothetical protein